MWKALAVAAGLVLTGVQAGGDSPAAVGSMPIPVSAADLAAAAGISRVDSATLPLDIVRLAFGSPDGAIAAETRVRTAVANCLARQGAGDLLPLPLTPQLWARVLGKAVSAEGLAAAIFNSRRAALLYHGLMGVEPVTLAWLAANPAVVDILADHAAVSSLYARSLVIRDGRVVTPGEADDVWTAIAGADPRQPAAFIEKVLSARNGRLAELYDAIAHLDAPHVLFALGATGDPNRVARTRRLYDAITRHAPRWRHDVNPFMRSDVDAALLFRTVRVTPNGDLAPSAPPAVWSRVFGTADDRAPLDAASLAASILGVDDSVARQRLDQFLFAQRALAVDASSDPNSLAAALDAVTRYPALMLTLEPYGFDASGYASAARAAAGLDGDEDATAVFQAGLAILDRARRSGTLDVRRSKTAIVALVNAARSRTDLISWIRFDLVGVLRSAVGGGVALPVETLVLTAMAGPRTEPGTVIAWEGQRFRVDLAGAELRRLSALRRAQHEAPLETAMGTATSQNLTTLARSLAAITYADALGDPGGQAGDADPWRRHRFGYDPGRSARSIAWRLALEVFAPQGWHLEGSLLRLDLALAPLALRRLDATQMPAPSILSTMERRTLAMSIALADARLLTDADRDAIAAALVRGRARAARLPANRADLEAMTAAAGVSEWRANAMRWTLENAPESAAGQFTVLELFRLGGGQPLTAWGTSSTPIDGCFCLRFPERGAFEEFAGRPSSGQLATQFADIVLRIAEVLAARGLPAVLTRDVAAFAVQEIIDRAQAVYFDNWLPVAFAARDLRDDQFDDYIAALTVAGPLLPEKGTR